MANVPGVLTLSYCPSEDTSPEAWLRKFGVGCGKGDSARAGNHEPKDVEAASGDEASQS